VHRRFLVSCRHKRTRPGHAGPCALRWWWSGSGGFAAAAVGAFDDANQNCGSNNQDAVDRIELAVHVVVYP
jgi:hypothetical protein